MPDSKILQHPSSNTTPETFCAMIQEHAGEIEHIACVIQWKSGPSEVFQTTMKNVDVTWLRWIFDQDFRPDYADDSGSE